MITALSLRNFKCFRNQPFELRELNVFAGTNGAGKSTVAQALLLLFQSYQRGDMRASNLRLNGPLVELGTARDILFRRSESDEFEIGIESDVGSSTFSALVRSGSNARLVRARTSSDAPRLRSFRNYLLYLSADRLGPQLQYPSQQESQGNAIGRRGEFAPLLYQRQINRNARISNDALILGGSEESRFFKDQFGRWMAKLFPGFDLRADLQDRIDSVVLGMTLNEQIGEAEFMRPSNVAFGVSVAFPIVVAGLVARKFSTLIVENPEAHLHASAQSSLGEFLARVASGGVQVFVETHSEHVVNGMRLAIQNGVLEPSQCRFFAFRRGVEFGSNAAEQVGVDSNGRFTSAPESFFDQADKDLRLLYGF